MSSRTIQRAVGMKSAKILLASLFGVLIIIGLTRAAFAATSTLSAEDPKTHLTTLDVIVGSFFSVDIWIRGIPSGDPMDNFAFDLGWDPALMQYDSSQGNPPVGWQVDVDDANAPSGTLDIGGSTLQGGNP